jgi:hypothetical protein
VRVFEPYLAGNYGFHWLCYQAANAYCYRKWNLTPVVNYWWSVQAYGLYGSNPLVTQGISERLDAVGGVHRGCVPGNNCFYNVTPPYADLGLALVFEPLAQGHGFGLDLLWNPRKGWVESGATFVAKTIPFTGPEETW